MPSPIGHALAGLGVALASNQKHAERRHWPLLGIVCAALAVAPDLDLLYPGGHRKMTHSLFAVGVVFLAAAVVTRARLGSPSWRVSLACALAYGTHLLTDYFGVDPGTPAGIQLLWPWSGEWFISSWSIFRATERYDPLSAFAMQINALALLRELLVIGPFVLLAWLRRRRLASAPEHPAQGRPVR